MFSRIIISMLCISSLYGADKCPEGKVLCPQGNKLCEMVYQRAPGLGGKCAPQFELCPRNAIACTISHEHTIPWNFICDAYDLSVMSYLKPEIIKKISLRPVYNTLKITSSYSLPYLFHIEGDVIWVVVRGSDSWKDYWHVLFNTTLVQLPSEYQAKNPKLAGVRFHEGIIHLALELLKSIKHHEKEFLSKKIRFAGHSLGGAVASLAALLTKTELGFPQIDTASEQSSIIDAVITFGAPPITNKDGATIIRKNFNEFVTTSFLQVLINNEIQPFLIPLINKEYEFFAPVLNITFNEKGTTYAYMPEPDNIPSSSFLQMWKAYQQHNPKNYLKPLENLGCKRRLLPSRSEKN